MRNVETKEAAANRAAQLVEPGMVIGLGSGSTASLLVKALGARVREGLQFTGVPTSEATELQAHDEGISLATLEDYPFLDLDIDGADAIDPALNLIKGLGGALLREKIVAASARRFIVIADQSKLVQSLSETPIIPVEVIPFGWSRTAAIIERIGAIVSRRVTPENSELPFRTDGGHYILDCHFITADNPVVLAAELKGLTGVVDHGLFIGMASLAIIGNADGTTREMVAAASL